MEAWPPKFGHPIGVEQESQGLQLHHGPTAAATAWRHKLLRSGFRGQRQLLEAGPGGSLQPPRLLDRHQHRRFRAAT